MKDRKSRTSRPGIARLTLTIQLVIFVAAFAGVSGRFSQLRKERELPPVRTTPLTVEPGYDYEVVVSDEQLRRVLTKLVPRDYGAETRINNVDHALRFWGKEATFEDPKLLSGEEMRRLLVDYEQFTAKYGTEKPPLLMDQEPGVRVRVQEGTTTSSHVDHTLATLAEVGTPLTFPIRTPARQTTFGEILRQSLRDFSLNQIEYEWSGLSYVLFLPPNKSWVTSEGQQVSFDLLAKRIMRQDMPQGVCYGNHRLFTLAIFLRVDQLDPATPILSPECRQEILEYLDGITALLVRHQHPDGFWNVDWPFEAADSSEPSDREGDSLERRILVTGHALEWWAMAPRELHPPRPVLVAAGQWLVKSIDGLTEDQTKSYYTFLTHAGRALTLWRGKHPWQVDLHP